MKKLLLFAFLLTSGLFYAQVGIGTTTPDPSTMLDVQSTESGFAMPRMTSDQRNDIPDPIAGLQVYDTDYKTIWYFDGAEWRSLNPVAYGRINGDGSPYRIFGATSKKKEKGYYIITFNTEMPTSNYIVSLSLRRENIRTRIYWYWLSKKSFEVHIEDFDGNAEDNMFMFTVHY